jgi:hypothetical protein
MKCVTIQFIEAVGESRLFSIFEKNYNLYKHTKRTIEATRRGIEARRASDVCAGRGGRWSARHVPITAARRVSGV